MTTIGRFRRKIGDMRPLLHQIQCDGHDFSLLDDYFLKCLTIRGQVVKTGPVGDGLTLGHIFIARLPECQPQLFLKFVRLLLIRHFAASVINRRVCLWGKCRGDRLGDRLSSRCCRR